MKLRRLHRLGSSRVLTRLVRDVNMAAVPLLRVPFTVRGPDEISVGGDAPKDFIDVSKRRFEEAYIAKAPRREGPRECVTEHLIACIGQTLPISIARGRLVRFPVPHGKEPDIRYMSRFFLNPLIGEQLVHASQLLAKCLGMKEDDLNREIPRRGEAEWQLYSTSIIESMLLSVGGSAFPSLREGFARMLAFDALVGANDRHAQNWGVIENALKQDVVARFAPIYDTARGLFWNHADEKLAEKNRSGSRAQFIESYANKSASLIGVPGRAAKPNHFDVIEHLVYEDRSEYLAPVREVVRAFRPTVCTRLLHGRFGRILSPLRLGFIDELLRHRHRRLLSLLA